MSRCMEVKDIVKEAATIIETASFKDAVALMIEQKTNSLLVVNNEGKLVGEITISELLEAVVPEYLDEDGIAAHFVSNEMFEKAVSEAADKEVQFFMSEDITPITLNDELMVAATKAIAHKKVRLPVVNENNEPVGIISRRGLKHIIAHTLNIPDSE